MDELRKYFSLISKHHSTEEEDLKKLENDISKSVMELEQLMRRDLGHIRNLSKDSISLHLNKK